MVGGSPADHGAASGQERAAIVGLRTGRADRARAETSLDELAGLAAAAGAVVVTRLLQERDRPDPGFFLGRGKVQWLAGECAARGIDLVVLDNELSPAQLRNLERELDRKVLDRTQLILDIFARRARTREGKLQVELAQLKYLLPRLVGAHAALSRLGGGIGTRGPGETKLETDRRKIRQRIAALTRAIDAVRQRRVRSRQHRRRNAVPTVALVGYTNAGKTTLFNRLTRSAAPATDALFVTLDPLVRQVRPPGGEPFLLSDTVGFVDRLPHTLVVAFRATLEEVAEADLLLHVVDAADPEHEQQMAAVRGVLEQVGADKVPRLDVFNKCDLIDEGARDRLARSSPDAGCVSALLGEGDTALLDAITTRLGLDTRRVTLEFDADSEADRRRIATLYRHGRVVRHEAVDGRISIEAEVPRRALARLETAPA